MKKIKRILYAVAVFIVLLILIQAFISAAISTIISDVYFKSLINLFLSVSISYYLTREIINNRIRRKL